MNRYWIEHSENGKIFSCGSYPEAMTPLPLKNGQIAEVDQFFDPNLFFIVEGSATAIPESPSYNHVFNYANKQWADPRTLADMKALKNAAINASRLQATQSHFMFQGHKIATDPLSRSDIDATHGAILMLQTLPPGWPGAWKTLDNDYVAIPDEATWGQFYGAMVAQGTANFNHSQALKAQLAAASTLAEVEAVADW